MGVPKNLPAFSVSEAVEKANEMPGDEVVAGSSRELKRLVVALGLFQLTRSVCIIQLHILKRSLHGLGV